VAVCSDGCPQSTTEHVVSEARNTVCSDVGNGVRGTQDCWNLLVISASTLVVPATVTVFSAAATCTVFDDHDEDSDWGKNEIRRPSKVMVERRMRAGL
jgi:hypothetical protein